MAEALSPAIAEPGDEGVEELDTDGGSLLVEPRHGPLGHALSAAPRVYRQAQVLTADFCDELVALGRARVADTGSEFSSSSYLREPEDFSNPLIRRVAEIATTVAGLPLACAEPVSITRYAPRQKYNWHYDDAYYSRCATWLAYLNSVEDGGETVFPLAEPALVLEPSELPPVDDFHPEALQGGALAIAPRKGDAILFYNRATDGSRDDRALHGSLPVRSAEKWVVQVWLHGEPNLQTGAWAT
mmetsp:Transcript_45723/g.126883  ORF Transcript_45723/g.126883 Transcript_45723/m.126883 type:complete len:243 (-) Transcript_45723:73-801(-)